MIDMIENKKIMIKNLNMIDDFNKKESKNFRMDAISKFELKRRLQFEKTKILFIEYETKQ